MRERGSVWVAIAIEAGRPAGHAARALAEVVLVVVALLLPNVAGAQDAITGQLLVAEPDLVDPNFSRTVVLIVSHDAGGALGVVVNRPYGRLSAGEVLEQLGRTPLAPGPEVDVCYGGPVRAGGVMVLHSRDYRSERSQEVTADIAVTAAPEVMDALIRGDGPEQVLVALGYAGWGRGQLERELGRGSWSVVDVDPALVFAEDPSTVWQRALRRRGVEL
jgi:putative transcriptional regulator